MMAGVGAGLAQVKKETGAPMEAKLAEMEGAAVKDISGRAMELDLLRQSKGEAQTAAGETKAAISGQDKSSLAKGLFTKENIKGMGAFLSGLSKKKSGDEDDYVTEDPNPPSETEISVEKGPYHHPIQINPPTED